jgi:hypothetical protein
LGHIRTVEIEDIYNKIHVYIRNLGPTPKEQSSPHTVPPLRIVPSFHLGVPPLSTSSRKVPPPRLFLSSNCSSPQTVPHLRLFLPSECPTFRKFLTSEFLSFQNAPFFRMLLFSERSILQRMLLPLERSSTQNVSPFMMFLPSE